jgi:hypothetical protein
MQPGKNDRSKNSSSDTARAGMNRPGFLPNSFL